MKATARRRRGFAHDIEIDGGHTMVMDEPVASGGGDEGPSPSRAVAAALAGCTAITVEMYAERKGWELGDVEVEADMDVGPKSSIESVTVTLRVSAPLDDEERRRLIRIAGRCPVHRALSSETEIEIEDRIEVP